MPEQEIDVDAVSLPTDMEEPRKNSVSVPTLSIVKARERAKAIQNNPVIMETQGLTKKYGTVVAANNINIKVKEGSFTGIVGPNGAGKTTTLSMMSGLNRPSSGRVLVGEVSVWSDGPTAKRIIGSLPDRLRLFGRLTGAQLLYYAGVLQGVKQNEIRQRSKDLGEAFALESALNRRVEEYSAGMQKKIALACAMIHSPKVLILDEPYETIDPVSASNVTQMLEQYVAGGGSVILSSHSLELIERVCDHVAVIVEGDVVAQGTVDEVRAGIPLVERFKSLTRESETGKGISWLHGSVDSE
ncbi:MAG TPA: ABC transporter ATP-binding protein [Microbacteriaceae bacterium]|nr:ABC transporter ATP-binding protein [Microbacteriaceae bacterium]